MLSGEKVLFRPEQGSTWVKSRSSSIDHEGHNSKASTSFVKPLHTSFSPNCEVELTIAPISQGHYEVTIESTTLRTGAGAQGTPSSNGSCC